MKSVTHYRLVLSAADPGVEIVEVEKEHYAFTSGKRGTQHIKSLFITAKLKPRRILAHP